MKNKINKFRAWRDKNYFWIQLFITILITVAIVVGIATSK